MINRYLHLFRKDHIQIILLILLAVFSIGSVYAVNSYYGYMPPPGRAIRNLIMILTMLPFILAFKIAGYKGSFRLFTIIGVLLTIGLTIRYDFEVKNHYENILMGKALPEKVLFSVGYLEPIMMMIFGYFLCGVVFIIFHKNPSILQRRYLLLSILSTSMLILIAFILKMSRISSSSHNICL